MKKKQARRLSKSGIKDNTSSSEDEKTKCTPRRSSRKKKVSTTLSRDSGIEVSKVDSAYEADDSARSDTSPKQKAVDEYEIDTIEDVPVVPKARKRINGSQDKQNKGGKKKKLTNLNMSTSTPVYEGSKSSNNVDCHLSTPDVTPILAVCHTTRSSKNNDNSTPTISRPLRKRSFSFQDTDLSAISAQLSFDSQGDSGIVISPALKKIKPSKAMTSPDIPRQKSSKCITAKCPKLPETSPVSTGSSKLCIKRNRNHLSPNKWENYSSVKGKAILRESSMNNSCFGFDSIQTPSPVSHPKTKKRKRSKSAKKSPKASDKAYRSPKDSSDSVFDDSPGVRNNSTPVDTDTQENIVLYGSPSLFSDGIFSDDGDFPIVNKVANKSYKGVKTKVKKSKPQVSKLDAWAHSFQTELDNIEKFDLNIE